MTDKILTFTFFDSKGPLSIRSDAIDSIDERVEKGVTKIILTTRHGREIRLLEPHGTALGKWLGEDETITTTGAARRRGLEEAVEICRFIAGDSGRTHEEPLTWSNAAIACANAIANIIPSAP